MVAITLTKEVYQKVIEIGELDQVIYVLLNVTDFRKPNGMRERGYGISGQERKETAKGYKAVNVKNTTKAILDKIRKANNCSYSAIIEAGLPYVENMDIPTKCSEFAKENKDISHAVSDLLWTEGFEYSIYLYKHQYSKIPEKYLNVLREMVGGNYLR